MLLHLNVVSVSVCNRLAICEPLTGRGTNPQSRVLRSLINVSARRCTIRCLHSCLHSCLHLRSTALHDPFSEESPVQ